MIKESLIRQVIHGKDCIIINPCNLYECTFGDNVFIGPFTEIQSKVYIGDGTRVQSHCFICSKVFIESNCFIGHGVIFINDTFSDGQVEKQYEKWKPTYVGNNVKIGSGSTILPVKIVDNVVIGAGSVVTKDINKSGVYFGNPAEYKRPL